jgi:elongation factor Ts
MAEISAQKVNELRKMTGLGLMECKSLLKEADGDLDRAVTLAKERGLKHAEKRAGRAANAGRIEAAFSADRTAGALVELNCETDFVARNEAFRQAAKDLAEQVLANGEAGLAEQTWAKDPSRTVREFLMDLNARTGENVSVSRAVRFSAGGRVDAYIHHDAKSGALVEVRGSAGAEELGALAKDLALQVVAAKPLGVRREDMPAETVEEEKRIYLKQVAEQLADKPEAVREKIATGKLDAWFRQNTLLEQEFVRDPSKKVKDVIAAAGKDATVARFVRYVVGEGEPAGAMA